MTKPATKNQYNLHELAGAFGDIGTLIPFVAAYVSVLHIAPSGILLAFGVALMLAGWYYRTPFPVQPMKAIGAAAATQTALVIGMSPGVVTGAGLVTAVIWLFLGATGLAKRVATLVPRPALLGVVMGLGFGLMLEGIRMMATAPWLSAVLLAMTLLLLARPRMPAMVLLLAAGLGIALVEQPSLAQDLAQMRLTPQWPVFAWPDLVWRDLWQGALLLALPQLPLTFGNALIAITDENNRLFPDRPVTERKVAFSTGLLNLWSSAIGGVPLCHGAGGMAGHVQFGARTGGASVMLGVLLAFVGLCLGESVATLFRIFPPPVLGAILFLAGIQLALGAREPGTEKTDRFVVLTTAAFAMWNVGIAVIFGFLAWHAFKRGWIKA